MRFILSILAALVLAAPAGAAKTWTNCAGTSIPAQASYKSRECALMGFTASSDDQRVACDASECRIVVSGSGSVSVQVCAGDTSDGSNCFEECALSSSDRACRISLGEWWLDVTGSGTVEIRGQ